MKAFPRPWSHAALSPTQTPTTRPKASPRTTWVEKPRRGRCVMAKRNRGRCVVNKGTSPGQAEPVSGHGDPDISGHAVYHSPPAAATDGTWVDVLPGMNAGAS